MHEIDVSTSVCDVLCVLCVCVVCVCVCVRMRTCALIW